MADTKLQVIIDARDRASAVITKLQGKFDSARSTLNKYNGVVKAASVAIGGLVAFSVKCVNAFGAQEQAQARLTAGLKNVAGMTDKNARSLIAYASELQKVTTFGDEQIVSAQAMLSTFQLDEKSIKTLTPRILDMAASLEKSSGQTQDLEGLSIALGKAVGPGGTAGALKRYGVVMTEAQEAQFDMATGMDKVNLVAEILDGNFKGIAEESAKTMTGQIRQMQNSLSDLQEEFGAVIAEAITPFVKKLTEWAQRPETIDHIKLIAFTIMEIGRTLVEVGKGFIDFSKMVGNVIAWPIEKFIELDGWINRVEMNLNNFRNKTIGKVSSIWEKATSWIPGLQEGGIVTKPTLAMLGEKGPEAVIPLDRAGGPAGNTFNFNFSNALITDKDKLIREIKEVINRESELRNLGGT